MFLELITSSLKCLENVNIVNDTQNAQKAPVKNRK